MTISKGTLVFIVAALVLLPGFYVYQLYVFQGFRPILGGYLVFASIVAGALLAIPYIGQAASGEFNAIDAVYWVLTCFCAAWATYQAQYDYAGEASHLYASAAPGWVCFFLLGRQCPFQSRVVNRVAVASFLFMAAVVLMHTSGGSFEIGVTQQSEGDAAQNATYQIFAIILVATLYVVALTIRSRAAEVVMMGLGAIVLFLIGSRSEAIFVALIAGYFVATSRYKFATGLAALLLATPLLLFDSLLSLANSNRFTALFTSRQGYVDEARIYANRRAVEIVRESPLVGDYGNYPAGLYAHNIMSTWVDFGFVGFALYVLLLGLPLWLLLTDYMRGDRGRSLVMVLSALGGVIILMLTTKSDTYYIAAFAVGLAAQRHGLSLAGRAISEGSHDQAPEISCA